MFLAPQGQHSQTLLPRQKRDRSLDFKNVTPERMQKAEEERRKYLESNSGVDKHNLADDIYNFMSTQPGDTGHATTGLPRPMMQPIMMTGGPSGKEQGGMGIQAPFASAFPTRPNPYSAPPQMGGGFGGQMGGGMGGGQGMGQFMQFMQTMMQMFQQFQGGGGRGMGGGFRGPSPFMPQQQQYGQRQPQPAQLRAHQSQSFQPQRMSNQFNPNNAFGGY